MGLSDIWSQLTQAHPLMLPSTLDVSPCPSGANPPRSSIHSLCHFNLNETPLIPSLLFYSSHLFLPLHLEGYPKGFCSNICAVKTRCLYCALIRFTRIKGIVTCQAFVQSRAPKLKLKTRRWNSKTVHLPLDLWCQGTHLLFLLLYNKPAQILVA